MPTIFIGLLALALVLWLAKSFAKADPKYMIKVGRTAGGIVALAGAAFLGVRGQLAIAVPLGVTGLGLLGYVPHNWLPSWMYPLLNRERPRKVSQVRSNFLAVELDHESGAMTGEVIAGRHAGAKLAQLELSTLIALLGEFDAESRDLLAAYLDRRHPRWREDAQGDAAAGSGPPRSGKMTKEEAYQILGLEPGASAEEIGRAHRGLMKKLHPDQGGSTYLAARVNEAKDVLLRRHR
jgi:DnaJ domain